jgi:O-antigen/teichoic acid export membrane protein
VIFGVAVGYAEVIVLGIVIAGAGLLGQVVTDVLSISLQAQLLLGRLTIVELTRRTLALVLVGALSLGGAGLLPLLAATSVASVAALALIAWLVRSLRALRPAFQWHLWRDLFAETLPFAVALSIAAIYLYVTVIVMSLIASATQTGLFATSFRVIQVALAVPSLLLTAIFPVLLRAQHNREEGPGDAVGRVFTVAVICGVWMSLATALGASFIVDIVAGHKGRGAVSVLQIQGAIFAVSFVSTSSALNLVSLRRYRALIVASAATLTLNIALSLALVPPLGARGGAISDVAVEALAATGFTAIVLRAVRGHGINATLLPPLALACVPCGLLFLLPIGSVARTLLGSLLYFVVLLRCGAIPHELLDAVRRRRIAAQGS